MTDPLDVADAIVYGAVNDYVADVRTKFVEIATKQGELTLADQETLQHLPMLSQQITTQAILEHQSRMSDATLDLVQGFLVDADANTVRTLIAANLGRMAMVSTAYAQDMARATAENLAATLRQSTVQAGSAMSTAWVEAYGTAVAKYNQGAAYRDVMEEAISKFVTDGTRISAVPRITYVSASGRVTRQDLDVALRRHIVTQANQAKMRMVDARAAEFGHDLVWTSAHFGARPSHAEWQGQVFSRTGASREYPPLVEATGYGTAGGLCGVNCRHTFAPYLPETKLPELPETMNGLTSEQHYQVTQQQRAMEREISKLKQEVILGQQAGLPMTQARLKLGHKQRQLKAHTDHYKLPRNYLRERAWGVEKQPMRLTSAKWKQNIDSFIESAKSTHVSQSSFMSATDMKSLMQMAEDIDLHLRGTFAAMNFDNARHALSMIDDIRKAHPSLSKIQGSVEMKSMAANIIADTEIGSASIRFNTRYFSANMKSEAVYRVAAHEMGHVIEHLLAYEKFGIGGMEEGVLNGKAAKSALEKAWRKVCEDEGRPYRKKDLENAIWEVSSYPQRSRISAELKGVGKKEAEAIYYSEAAASLIEEVYNSNLDIPLAKALVETVSEL